MIKISRKGIIIVIIIIFIGAIIATCTEGNIGQVERSLDDTVYQLIDYKENHNVFFGYPPNEEWNVTLGGNDIDVGRHIIQIPDGYVFVGRTKSFGNGGFDLWLVKIDNNGNEVWNKTYGGYDDDWGSDICYTIDECFVVTGCTYSYDVGDGDVWLLKVDNEGNELWTKTFGDEFRQGSWSIEETKDGGFIIGTYTFMNLQGTFNGGVIKTDSDGNEIWNKTYGGLNDEWILEVHQTVDSGFICIGASYSDSAGGADVWLFKIDIQGNVEWMNLYGGPYHDNGFSVTCTSDGGFILCAESKRDVEWFNEPVFYDWVIKTDDKGSIIWEKLFGENNFDIRGSNIDEAQDEGYILVASGDIIDLGNDIILLFKIDHSGNVIWNKRIDDAFRVSDDFSEASLCLTSDNGCILIGSNFINNNVDAWVLKFPFFDNNRPDKPMLPNGPSTGKIRRKLIFTTSTVDSDDDQVCYLFDWGDGTDSGWLGPYESGGEIEASHKWVGNGSYKIKVKAKDVHSGESDWSDPLSLVISKNKTKFNYFISIIFEHLKLQFPILSLFFDLEVN